VCVGRHGALDGLDLTCRYDEDGAVVAIARRHVAVRERREERERLETVSVLLELDATRG
jgi:hypothetical protein